MYQEKTFLEKFSSFAIFGLVPMFAFVTVLLIPFITGLFLTFTNWGGNSSIFTTRFVWSGLTNYIDALRDPRFWETLWLTIRYVIFVVVFTNLIAFLLAVLVSSNLKGKNVFKSIFFVPNLMGGVILGFIWQFIFSKLTVHLGAITGLEFLRFSWLVDTDKAFIAIVIVTVWQLSGYMMLIYIAGLTSIPNEVIEAASLDGVTGIQQYWYIKIPLMVPAFTISLFLTLRNSFMMYDANLSLTNGGPFRSTELISMHIYNEAFRLQHYQTGQAKAIVLFVIVAVIATTQVFITKRFELSEK
jgi:raffinose/stachyose/melibiose transport system permease protein